MIDSLPPLLKWPGGKRWLVPTLAQLYEPYRDRTYVSLFVGGGADAFGLAPARAIINDINPHLMNFYTWVQSGVSLHHTTVSTENTVQSYAHNRCLFNRMIEQGTSQTPTAAMLFYYLNKAGYNGLCRFNRKGLYNVPYGKYDKLRFLPYPEGKRTLTFSHYSSAMHGWSLSNSDFAEVDFPDGAAVYADPPYDDGFTNYSAGGFSWDDQVRLVKFLADYDGPVIICNKATSRIEELYLDHGYSLTHVDAPRRISCNGNRDKVVEVLAIKGK